jgi:hypothetical protein
MKRPVTLANRGVSTWFPVVVLALLASAALATEPLVPVFGRVPVHAVVSFDAGTGQFLFDLQITNPIENTLSVQWMTLDISSERTAPPVTVFGPSGWRLTDATADAKAMWWCAIHAVPLSPGSTAQGLGFRTTRLPAIRDFVVNPDVFPYIEVLFADREAQGKLLEISEQAEIQDRYVFRTKTLGPLGAYPGTFGHWNTWQADIAQARQLGWISDAGLAATIETNVAAARQAVLASDSATARTKLQAVIDAIQGSQPSERTSEGYALVFFNAQYLRDHLPTPCAPRLSLAPESATQPIGTSYTATASLVNVADGKPFAGFGIYIRVTSGPHVGTRTFGGADANGNFALTYTGAKLGEDVIEARTLTGPGEFAFDFESSTIPVCIPLGLSSPLVKVKWEGGPDLAVTSFFPPVIKKTGGQGVLVTEETENLGNTAAPPLVTRYYLSATESIDPATARVTGERSVPELAAGASSSVDEYPFTVPSDLPEGLYYLGACADADGTVIETNEDNNCSFSKMAVKRQTIVAIERANQPPDCSQVHADPSVLWPPNHRLVPIQILGVTDPEGDPISITVTGITQDEPTNGLGDGDTSPDAVGVGTSQVQVRAERAGSGNGRVYVISFHAGDGQGGTCAGSVKVTVPHDKGKGEAVDDGQSYDSTK